MPSKSCILRSVTTMSKPRASKAARALSLSVKVSTS